MRTEKRQGLVKLRFPHLISRKAIINVNLESFKNNCGGYPLQLCHWTAFAKIRNKKNVIVKNLAKKKIKKKNKVY